MTNFEKIKTMTIEEMAGMLPNVEFCHRSFNCIHEQEIGCFNCSFNWLNKEATE